MSTQYRGTPQEELALNTYIKLTRATESLIARLYDGGKFHGLTASQFGTLEALFHLGPMCQGEIGEKILKSSGNMTMVIDNLEKNHLVQRARDPEDRRQVIVSLTEKGRELIAGIFPGHVASIVEQIAVLSPQEQRTLGDLLRRLGSPQSQSKEVSIEN